MKMNIDRVAKLANLPLTTSEKREFEPQLNETLTYIEQLNEVDTSKVTPTSQVTGLENILRADVDHESLTQDQALSNTKSTQDGYFQVEGVLDDE